MQSSWPTPSRHPERLSSLQQQSKRVKQLGQCYGVPTKGGCDNGTCVLWDMSLTDCNHILQKGHCRHQQKQRLGFCSRNPCCWYFGWYRMRRYRPRHAFCPCSGGWFAVWYGTSPAVGRTPAYWWQYYCYCAAATHDSKNWTVWNYREFENFGSREVQNYVWVCRWSKHPVTCDIFWTKSRFSRHQEATDAHSTAPAAHQTTTTGGL